MGYVIVGVGIVLVLVLVLILILVWYWYKPSSQTSTQTQTQTQTQIQPSSSLEPVTADTLASQNAALSTSQVQEDQTLRANTTVSTTVRGYSMPTSRDHQLQLMTGNWATSDGIMYTIDSVDLVQDKFNVTKSISTKADFKPVSIGYVSTGWNNNVLQALGTDGRNATFIYEGASMVIQTAGLSILTIRL